ncbi:MAG: TetR/AcrR family transcriptional regulator [Flavobacteriaceae bacterium]|jgi:AcrR family transcriptional regulator
MKKEIIEATLPLFLRIGFKNVTMDDVAQNLSISKKTVYEHFDNKKALIEAAVNRLILTIGSEVEMIQNAAENPISAIYKVKTMVLQYLKDEENSPQIQLQKYYPEIYQELKFKEFDLLGNHFRSSLQKGIEMNLFREDIDIDFISRIYFSGLRNIRDIKLFPRNQFQIEELMGLFFEYHLRAISTEKGIMLLNEHKQS